MSHGIEFVVVIGDSTICPLFEVDATTFFSQSRKHPTYTGVPTMYNKEKGKARVWPNPAPDCRVMRLVPVDMEDFA